ncbi:protein of unknown function [Magnetospirillum sp. XM-1]|uniref:hypothetical protein n=1 Tax=Magnetospirillum sp. XM-1 TaxID=1663591 RepID=UPI00073DFDA3|nr:hypothetical protein [Magnetospirillum sp. XM-1]CUW38814.1 protein of unknown function [Magnetospirillum sp. XM-1]
MTIDWSKEIETTEDPPRPVRVLATDGKFRLPVIVEFPDGNVYFYDLNGEACPTALPALRSVPPKPKPVLMEGWVKLYANDGQWPSASSSVFTSEDDARESVTMREPLAICKVAWMSDGSPVPSEASEEEDPTRYGVCEVCVEKAVKAADEWRTKAEALQAEVDDWKSEWEIRCRTVSKTLDRRRINETEALKDEVERLQEVEREWCALHHAAVKELHAEVDKRNDSILDHLERIQAMKPVVDAAVDRFSGVKHRPEGQKSAALWEAVRAYQSKQVPAEPVKNCTTCRFNHIYHADEPCNVCAGNTRRKPFKSYWEPRHD